METCANPGCSEPGTNKCAGCKTTPYCGPICQTAHWPTHKESCDGRLRKMGMDHLNKAAAFREEKNWSQALRHSELAATKLKLLKDRPLEAISSSFDLKCAALGFLGRYSEQLECAKEWYCLWNTKPTDVGAITAAFALILSCIHNKEYADAVLYASTLYEIINHKNDNKIPDNQRQEYIGRGAYYLANATLKLAQSGGIPSGEKQKAGQEAIALARRALDNQIQTYGIEHEKVANTMGLVAEALDHFNDDDDEEVLHLHEQARKIHAKVNGGSSSNVGVDNNNLGNVYLHRANRARGRNEVNRQKANLELALPRYREAARIFRAINRVEMADQVANMGIFIEKRLVEIASVIAALAATRG